MILIVIKSLQWNYSVKTLKFIAQGTIPMKHVQYLPNSYNAFNHNKYNYFIIQ